MSDAAKGKQGIWFPAKRHGWGWGLPVTWQGWLALLIYLTVLLTASRLLPPGRHALAFFAATAAATLGLLAVCWFKGERPRWR